MKESRPQIAASPLCNMEELSLTTHVRGTTSLQYCIYIYMRNHGQAAQCDTHACMWLQVASQSCVGTPKRHRL